MRPDMYIAQSTLQRPSYSDRKNKHKPNWGPSSSSSSSHHHITSPHGECISIKTFRNEKPSSRAHHHITLLRRCSYGTDERVYMGRALTIYTMAKEVVLLYAKSRRRCRAAGPRMLSSMQNLVIVGGMGGEEGGRRK